MTESTSIHHEINYVELQVKDFQEAKSFYGGAFGWTFNDYGPGPDYVGIRKQNGEGEVGGMCLSENVVTGGPLIILYSVDLETSLQSVRDAGGKITLDIISFPGGRRFQFCDPSGNELAVWSDNEPA